MSRRWIPLLLVGMILVSTAGACDPPPPAGWVPPTLQSVETTTTEIVAGSTFGVRVAATDDNQVSQVALRFTTKRAVDPLRVPCSAPDWVPGPEVSVEFSCTMPLIAANGAWTLTVLAYDGEWSGPHGACGCDSSVVPLTVSGGSEDGLPPVQESVVISPNPIPVGTTSVVTVHMSDEHLDDYSDPVNLQYAFSSGNPKSCTQLSQSRISPTVHEWVFECPPSSEVGEFLAIGYMRDAMGYLGEMRFTLNFVEAA